MSVSEFLEPETTRTRPSGSRVPVGYQRLKAIGLARIQPWMFGSKMSASLRPSPAPDRSHPPRVRRRPSARNVWPAQSRSTNTFGTLVNNLVAGSHSDAVDPSSHDSTLPEFSRCVCTGMAGNEMTEDHWPTCAGFVWVETFKGRVRTAAATSARARTRRFMRISGARRRARACWTRVGHATRIEADEVSP